MVVPRAGFEHATTRSSAERSPRLSYLGTLFHAFWMTSAHFYALGHGSRELNHLRFLRNIKVSFMPTHSKPCSRGFFDFFTSSKPCDSCGGIVGGGVYWSLKCRICLCNLCNLEQLLKQKRKHPKNTDLACPLCGGQFKSP
jgi:hypothetical protein